MKYRIVSFKIPEELLKKLDEHCKRLGVHRSKVIRLAIYFYLSQHGELNDIESS